jgi:hypothetical protein
MGESLVTHIETANNYADLMTKVLYGGRCRFLVSRLRKADLSIDLP